MTRVIYEFTESLRIAFAQIRANKLRSVLTALGVIIGIVAVTLMGTAINGIDIGFQRSLAMLGEDVLYVQKWPWHGVDDWWNYQNRPPFRVEMADSLNRIIETTPNSLLAIAVPVAGRGGSVKAGQNSVSGVSIIGSTASRPNTSAVRIACAALALASSAFDGTQPVHRQSPPTRARSTTATCRPRPAANSAAVRPADPIPTITRSNTRRA